MSNTGTILSNYINPASIEKVLDILVDSTLKDANDRSFWYRKSYKVYISRFAELRKNNKKEDAWIERVGMVYSWIKKIPVAMLDFEAIQELAALEDQLYQSSIVSIGHESYQGGQGNPIKLKYHGDRIFGTRDIPPIPIDHFIHLANRIINTGRNSVNLPTTSKLLHFLLPSLFPILDQHVANTVFGAQKNLNINYYREYIFSIQDYLIDGEHRELLISQAKDHQRSSLYILDQILFMQR